MLEKMKRRITDYGTEKERLFHMIYMVNSRNLKNNIFGMKLPKMFQVESSMKSINEEENRRKVEKLNSKIKTTAID